jgi:hypothetical protein
MTSTTGQTGGLGLRKLPGGRRDEAVVWVTVAVELLPPAGVIELGVTEHVPASTVVLQVSVVALVNCAEDDSVKVKVADWPADTEAVVGEMASAKSVPVPESATF